VLSRLEFRLTVATSLEFVSVFLDIDDVNAMKDKNVLVSHLGKTLTSHLTFLQVLAGNCSREFDSVEIFALHYCSCCLRVITICKDWRVSLGEVWNGRRQGKFPQKKVGFVLRSDGCG
jgi:hypothetical protein